MPYPRNLQQYCPPEFYAEPPIEWERRLREVSPNLSGLDHLVFRKFEPKEPNGQDRGWRHADRPIWTLYSATPIALVTPERAQDFAKHWSEMATEAERYAHECIVSNYQHFMWHSRGLYVKPFLILQGEWGGTPAKYTKTEEAFLKGSECMWEPMPIGSFPACPFDERTVKTIALRDRLLQCSNNYDRLAALDTPEGIAAAQLAAEQVHRETYIDTWKILVQPQADFVAHYMKRSEHRDQFPSAPKELTETIGKWKDHFMEHGKVLGAGPAHTRLVQ